MITVVGAGPAGCHYASLVKDEDVTIIDKKPILGQPVQCTGIVTDSISRVLKIPDELVVSTIKKFRIISPNGKSVDVDLGKENKVMDRARFDEYTAQLAVDNGAKIVMNNSFNGFKKVGENYEVISQNGRIVSSKIVGADGPFSQVAKSADLYGRRSFLEGLQVRAEYKGEVGVCEVYMGVGEFAWVVPEDEKIARIGVIGRNVKQDFRRLVGNAKVCENQSGIVPLYNPKQKLRKDNVFLIGDAATQVKATTYGGIIYGLLAGKFLSENPDTYEKEFNKKLGKDLWMSLKMRDALNVMSEKQANDLIQIFQKESNNKVLSEHDRDFPSKFVAQLLLKETKLWRMGFDLTMKKLFKK